MKQIVNHEKATNILHGVCIYCHTVERVSRSMKLPIEHIHNGNTFEVKVFKKVAEARKFLLNTRPLKSIY